MMPTNSTDWELYVNELAAAHHVRLGQTYQRIPDTTNGDGGLEGVSSNGCGYQAYFPENPRDGQALLKGQKRKVHDDLKKLSENRAFWSRFLAGRPLREWNLVVPEHADKELSAYLREQVNILRNENLPFLHQEFDGFVKTPADFSLAESDLVAAGILGPHLLAMERATDEDAAKFVETGATFMDHLDRKLLQACTGNQERATRFRGILLKNYLEACTFTDRLRKSQPAIYQRICEHELNHETTLALEDLDDTRRGGRIITETQKNYLTSLQQALPRLPRDRAIVLAAGTTAKWLGECPLKLDDEK